MTDSEIVMKNGGGGGEFMDAPLSHVDFYAGRQGSANERGQQRCRPQGSRSCEHLSTGSVWI